MQRYKKYKPTGIDWIGEIPEHRKVERMKDVCYMQNGYAFKPEFYVEEDGILIIRIGDFDTNMNFDLNNIKKYPYDKATLLSNFLIKQHDILIALTGATIGKSAEYNMNVPALLNQRVGLIRTLNDSYTKYIKFFISSHYFKKLIELTCSGSAQDNIGMPQISNFKIPLPPLSLSKKPLLPISMIFVKR